MAEDMEIWLKMVRTQVSWLADEEAQRRAWFGIGPEVDDPTESFEQFLSNAAVEEFLQRDNTGLSGAQLASLFDLYSIVNQLCTETNKEGYLFADFINDPRWQRVIAQAKKTEAIIGKAEPW